MSAASVLEKGGLSTPHSIDSEDGAPMQGQQSVEFPEGGLTGWSVVCGAYVVIDRFPPWRFCLLTTPPAHPGGYFSFVPSGTYIYAEIITVY